MDKEIRKILDWLQKDISEKLPIEFINYLNSFNVSKSVIKKAKWIDWKMISDYLNVGFLQLWDKFTIPQEMQLQKLSMAFREQIIDTIKFRLFYILYRDIAKIENESITRTDLNDRIKKIVGVYVYKLFTVFDFQLSLTSLNENNDPKVIIRKIDELKNKSSKADKFSGRSIPKDKLQAYGEILKRNDEFRANYSKDNFRTIAFNVAYKSMNLEHEKEKQNFYKTFMQWKKEKKVNSYKEYIKSIQNTYPDIL